MRKYFERLFNPLHINFICNDDVSVAGKANLRLQLQHAVR